MIKLQCKIAPDIDEVVKDLRVKYETKGKALKELLDLALIDEIPASVTVELNHFGTISCTLTVSEKHYIETQTYRLHHELFTKTDFFLFALHHGATLYRELTRRGGP